MENLSQAQATVESLNSRFLIKLNCLINIFAALTDIAPKEINNRLNINIKYSEILSLADEYKMAVAPAIAEYYSCLELEDDRTNKVFAELSSLSKFKRSILTDNFIVRIETFVRAAGSIYETLSNTTGSKSRALINVGKLIESLGNLKMSSFTGCHENNLLSTKVSSLCEDCNGALQVSYESAHFICVKCGRMYEITGAEYEKMNGGGSTYMSIGDGAAGGVGVMPRGGGSSSSQNENRHLNKCLDFLFGLKECPLSDVEEEKIRREISLGRYNIEIIYCQEMRAILKEVKLTKYNPYVPWLIKKFTGRNPPIFTDGERSMIKNKFNRLAWWYKKIYSGDYSGDYSRGSNIQAEGEVGDNGGERENLSHYYYFIYKIVEKEFAGNNEKLDLLKYIHLQSASTIKKNDAILEKIAGHAAKSSGEDFTFAKTKKFR